LHAEIFHNFKSYSFLLNAGNKISKREIKLMKKLWLTLLKIKLAVRIMIKCPELIPYLLPASLKRLFVPEEVLWK
jgi:hypothetical protein